jgi:hypothetical protein
MPNSTTSDPLQKPLPPEHAAWIIGSADPVDPYKEQRAHPRFPFRGRAKAVIFPPPTSPQNTTCQDSEVVTSDLSRGGVSILNRTELVPGQQLLLLLNDKNQMAEVRWCCKVWDGLFTVGCKFLTDPESVDIDEQLMAIDVLIASEQSWWDGGSSK